ncbi:hypothetical protein BJ508DRAFT_327438 [Ascobolus immersus RN42]|uniref:Uncharacterized protein n=1 Tax=Ascobolus immersus RN42 TaxID=1160509 RepID=A0A3N4IF48_ASCIM|nr:hypothetical protein BJ508DRAFT_327438 [Ascobolus immersus RN42]
MSSQLPKQQQPKPRPTKPKPPPKAKPTETPLDLDNIEWSSPTKTELDDTTESSEEYPPYDPRIQRLLATMPLGCPLPPNYRPTRNIKPTSTAEERGWKRPWPISDWLQSDMYRIFGSSRQMDRQPKRRKMKPAEASLLKQCGITPKKWVTHPKLPGERGKGKDKRRRKEPAKAGRSLVVTLKISNGGLAKFPSSTPELGALDPVSSEATCETPTNGMRARITSIGTDPEPFGPSHQDQLIVKLRISSARLAQTDRSQVNKPFGDRIQEPAIGFEESQGRIATTAAQEDIPALNDESGASPTPIRDSASAAVSPHPEMDLPNSALSTPAFAGQEELSPSHDDACEASPESSVPTSTMLSKAVQEALEAFATHQPIAPISQHDPSTTAPQVAFISGKRKSKIVKLRIHPMLLSLCFPPSTNPTKPKLQTRPGAIELPIGALRFRKRRFEPEEEDYPAKRAMVDNWASYGPPYRKTAGERAEQQRQRPTIPSASANLNSRKRLLASEEDGIPAKRVRVEEPAAFVAPALATAPTTEFMMGEGSSLLPQASDDIWGSYSMPLTYYLGGAGLPLEQDSSLSDIQEDSIRAASDFTTRYGEDMEL